jgi:hypothetical protein
MQLRSAAICADSSLFHSLSSNKNRFIAHFRDCSNIYLRERVNGFSRDRIHLFARRISKAVCDHVVATAIITFIYLIDFTPITQNLDFSNPQQVKEGFFGFFGFVGSIATLTAYSTPFFMLYLASAIGMLMIFGILLLYRKQYLQLWTSISLKSRYTNQTALFAAAIAIFVAITALALTYKRIPTDTFEGMFKGRYRMYSTLWCIAFYLGFLAVSPHYLIKKLSPVVLAAVIALNLIILHSNYGAAVNNRRAAIVQEFNARYNADWLGVKMFSMDQNHFEKIRSYYKSADPIAEGWNPRTTSIDIACDSLYQPDTVTKTGNHILVSFDNDFFKAEKDYSDGAYVLLKSPEHMYTHAPPNQFAQVPFKTTVSRLMYFSKGAHASFHVATVEPGLYSIYLAGQPKRKEQDLLHRTDLAGKRITQNLLCNAGQYPLHFLPDPPKSDLV